MKHMMLNELLAFADPSLAENGRRKIAAHISSCEACRKKFISLQVLKNSIRQMPEPLKDFNLTSSCLPAEEMGDFLGKRLPEKLRETYSSHIATCEMCFERAAFMSTETVKMTEGVLSMPPTPDRYKNMVLPKSLALSSTKKKVSYMATAKRWLSSPAPAYALAAACLLFITASFFGGVLGGDISKLASDKNFSFYEEAAQSGPSFGFSDAGRKVGQSEAALEVEKTGDEIRFSWNRVEGASTYSFSLLELTPAGPREVLTTSADINELTIEASRLARSTAYHWVVRGFSDDKTAFTAAGQFVNMP